MILLTLIVSTSFLCCNIPLFYFLFIYLCFQCLLFPLFISSSYLFHNILFFDFYFLPLSLLIYLTHFLLFSVLITFPFYYTVPSFSTYSNPTSFLDFSLCFFLHFQQSTKLLCTFKCFKKWGTRTTGGMGNDFLGYGREKKWLQVIAEFSLLSYKLEYKWNSRNSYLQLWTCQERVGACKLTDVTGRGGRPIRSRSWKEYANVLALGNTALFCRWQSSPEVGYRVLHRGVGGQQAQGREPTHVHFIITTIKSNPH